MPNRNTASAANILEPDVFLPEVPRHEAPWTLEGDAYVVVLKLPQGSPALHANVAPSLAGRSVRGPAALMFVDYRSSNCGPYQEILAIPGSLPFGERWFPSIGRIYVSTFDSVVNGRANWGIPKDRADFDVRYGVDGTREDLVRVSYRGRALAELRLRASRMALPVTTKVVPSKLRTLAQHWENATYFTAPTTSARVAAARVHHLRFDPELFPDLSTGRVLGAVKLVGFRMTFPVATVSPGLL